MKLSTENNFFFTEKITLEALKYTSTWNLHLPQDSHKIHYDYHPILALKSPLLSQNMLVKIVPHFPYEFSFPLI
jgi:hypothetical protein